MKKIYILLTCCFVWIFGFAQLTRQHIILSITIRNFHARKLHHTFV